MLTPPARNPRFVKVFNYVWNVLQNFERTYIDHVKKTCATLENVPEDSVITWVLEFEVMEDSHSGCNGRIGLRQLSAGKQRLRSLVGPRSH
jgi:hypothetical protein